MLKYIHQDEMNVIHFDPYFAYIQSVKDVLPPDLHAFACDVSRYELNGSGTLHDAWIEDMRLSNRYAVDSNRIVASDVVLSLRKAGGGLAILTYSDVGGIEFRGIPAFRPGLASDLLVHEVTVESEALYSHVFVFDSEISLKILFRTFSLEETAS